MTDVARMSDCALLGHPDVIGQGVCCCGQTARPRLVGIAGRRVHFPPATFHLDPDIVAVWDRRYQSAARRHATVVGPFQGTE